MSGGARRGTIAAARKGTGAGRRPRAPDIDDAGEVAFYGDIDPQSGLCNEAFLRYASGGIQVVAWGGLDPSCDYQVSDLAAPIAINGTGSVAYAPKVQDFVSFQLFGTVFVDSSKIWDARVPGFSSMTNLVASDVALNDDGEVAFRLEGDVHGVYTGADPVADKVLATGDPLCGSTVTEVAFQRYGLDPQGRLALNVALADGRSLIVRADPTTGPGGFCETAPEPEPAGAASAAIASLLGVAAAARGRAVRCRASTASGLGIG